MEKPDSNMTMGQRLVYWRKQSGMNQEEFALAMGVSHSAQQNYEKDLRTPKFEYLQALHNRGFRIGWLFGEPFLTISAGEKELTDAERNLVGMYRRASGEDQNVLTHMARVFAERAEPSA